MKYLIGHLIKGEVKKYQERLINNLSKNFGVRNLNDDVPAHFTLKAPFESDDIGSVEKLLERVCEEGKSSGVKIDGIGNFHRRVIYLNGRSSSSVNEFLRGLNNELRKISWMKFARHDLIEDNLHSTLARVKDDEQFEDVMKFLANEKPCFELEFDNVAIFWRKEEGWEVYREFALVK